MSNMISQYSLGSTPLLILFGLSTCPMLAYLSRFIPSFWWCAKIAVFTQTISPTTLPNKFLFSTNLGRDLITYRVKNCSRTLDWDSGLTPLKDIAYSESGPPIFSYLLPINNCHNCRIVLILILLILSCSLCQLFACILSLMPIYAICFDCQLGGQWKLSERNSNFLL